jgi:predicted ATPase/transcriptional regulator with XRE-family HTH domain
MDHPTFGRWLKLRRRSLDLTQAQLGQQTGYASETIRKVEADELRPSRQMAEKLAVALEIGPEERTVFIRFARDEAAREPVVLPAQVKPAPLPPPPQPLSQPEPIQTHPQRLPIPRDPLIGREWEVAVVQNLLLRPTVGLVTLTGPGGVGKTRLALQVAANLLTHTSAQMAPAFPAGVYFVPLAALDDPNLVLPAIAQMLDVREAEGQPFLTPLQDHLRDKQLLLVLDNFEQVIAAGPQISELLQAAPRLKVLVTSRTILRLRDEHPFAVPPLTVSTEGLPPTQADSSDDTIERLQPADLTHPMRFAAVHLFVERAQAVQTDFAVTSRNLAAILSICQQLDGLPLAIELAAARVRLLPPPAMLARLGSQLAFLKGGAHDLPARQQTMRATLAWSYDLLSEAERRLFRRLALFAGGCTLEAAEAVCNGDGALMLDTLDCLSSLIDKSLLQQKADLQGEPRFVQLRVIREYAVERLVESGEAETIHQRQATFFLAWVEAAEAHLTGEEQPIWLERLEVEVDNLRAILEWSTSGGDAAIGLRLAGALARFWHIRGHYQEGSRWLQGLLARSTAWTPVRAKALGAAGVLAGEQGAYGLARQCHQESLTIWRTLGEPRGVAAALHRLGGVALDQGDYVVASRQFTESLSIRREIGDQLGMAASLHNLGLIAHEQGDDQASHLLYEESLALERQLGNRHGIAISLNNLGNLARNQGDHTRAHALFTESLALRRELGDKHGIALALNNLGNVALEQGDEQTARHLLEEGLALQREIGNKSGAALALNNLGGLAHRQGDYPRALHCYREALLILTEMGDRRIAECLLGLALIEQATQQPERSVRLLAAGEALLATLGARLETASQAEYEALLAALSAELSEEQLALAWADGQSMRHEQVVAYALATP